MSLYSQKRGMSAWALAACVWLVATAGFGQMLSGTLPAGLTTSLAKVFEPVTAFSAHADLTVVNADKKETLHLPMVFSLLDGKIRLDITLSQVKSADLPSGTASSLREVGLERVISLVRPDKRMVYMICPQARSLLAMPLPVEDAVGLTGKVQVVRHELGKETIDAHPCVKRRVIITDNSGGSFEAITWSATDLKDFPIQIQTEDDGNVSTICYKQVQFTRPNATRFDPPTGYAQYKDAQELVFGVLKKWMAGNL